MGRLLSITLLGALLGVLFAPQLRAAVKIDKIECVRDLKVQDQKAKWEPPEHPAKYRPLYQIAHTNIEYECPEGSGIRLDAFLYDPADQKKKPLGTMSYNSNRTQFKDRYTIYHVMGPGTTWTVSASLMCGDKENATVEKQFTCPGELYKEPADEDEAQ